jgi:hypothetical protein
MKPRGRSVVRLILVTALVMVFRGYTGPQAAVAQTTIVRMIEAEQYQAAPASQGGTVYVNGNSSNNQHVENIRHNDFLSYGSVDFNGIVTIMIRLASDLNNGQMALYQGSASTPFVTISIPNTHGWAVRNANRSTGDAGITYSNGWRTVTVAVSGLSGTGTLRAVFTNTTSTTGDIVHLDWIRLLGTHTPKTYYVSTTGNDLNSGTSTSAPFRTIGHAVETLLPGDTVLIMGGTTPYDENIVIPATSSGASDTQRVTLKPYNSLPVTIDGGARTQEIIRNRADYLTIMGVKLQNTLGRGIVSDGDFVRFDSLRIENIDLNGMDLREQSGTMVRLSEITNTSRENYPIGQNHTTSGWRNAVIAHYTNNLVLSGNKIHDNYGEGIILGADTDDAVVSDNQVYDNFSVNIYLSTAHNALVERNLIWESETLYISRSTIPQFRSIATGITVADENEDGILNCNDPTFQPGGGHLIRNNIVVKTRRGFNFGFQHLDCSGVKNTRVFNNTFVEQWEESVYITTTTAQSPHSGSIFRNNIFHSRSDGAGRALTVFGYNDTIFNKNLFFKTGALSTTANQFLWSGTTSSSGATYSYDGWNNLSPTDNVDNQGWAAPGLVAQGNLTGIAANHKLAGGSPAIDAGSTSQTPNTDFFKNPRPRGSLPDIGAHEYAPCEVAYTVTDDWATATGRAFTASVTITNTASTSVNGWHLTWNYPTSQQLRSGTTQIWDAVMVSPGPTGVDVANASWTSTIGSGGSVTFGFNADYPTTNTNPTAFALNATACNLT